jgi:D-galactarolactone cycloisomerase
MKITAIEPILVAIPYDHGGPKWVDVSGKARATMDAVYLKVETDSGITGWGEAYGFGACALTHAAFDRLVTPMVLGRDIGEAAEGLKNLMDELHRRVASSGRNGPAIFALSGLDVALWDIRGKALGKPVHTLLNPESRTSMPAYASLLRVDEPNALRGVVQRALDRGYGHIKLHERTVECVAAARETVGPGYPLMLDVNCQWTPQQSLDMAQRLQPYDLVWLEEPLGPPDDYDALAWLRREQGIPIAAGENLGNRYECARIIEAGAVDVIQPDTIKMGGITEIWKAVEHARSCGVRAEPHSPFYGPGWIAAVHVVAAMHQDALCEFFFTDLEAAPCGDMIYPQNGTMTAPQGPGLGIEVDEDILARYRVM